MMRFKEGGRDGQLVVQNTESVVPETVDWADICYPRGPKKAVVVRAL